MEITPRMLLNILREVPFFKGFSISQAKDLLAICTNCQLKPGDILLREDGFGQEMYLLLSGCVRVVTNKQNILIARINAVGVIGEIGMLLEHPRSATVIADDNCQLLRIAKIKLNALFAKDPKMELQLYRNLCNILCEKLVKNNIKIEEYTILQHSK